MEIHTCSERVKKRALDPKYLGQDNEIDNYTPKKNHFLCHYHFPNSNGEITVYGLLAPNSPNKEIIEAKYVTNIKGPPLAFIDALIELSHRRNYHSLPLLSLREIESFLRDSNTVPSFSEGESQLYRYYDLISSLAQCITPREVSYVVTKDGKKELNPPTIEDYKPNSVLIYDSHKYNSFKNLDTDLKVKLVNDVLDVHVRPILARDGGDVECVHVMDNLVVINFLGNCGTCGLSLTSTMDFLKKVLRNELNDHQLDIITDS